MTCTHTEHIQAYLDGELTREQRKEFARHLEYCPDCRKALGDAKRLATWTDLVLSETFDEQAEMSVQIDVEAAWARLEAQLSGRSVLPQANADWQQPEQAPAQVEHMQPAEQGIPRVRSWVTMAKQYKKWIAGAVAAVAVVSVMTVPRVQAAGDELLSMMRVQNLQTLKVSDQDLQQIGNWIQSGQNGEKSLGSLGNIWVTNTNNGMQDRHFRTVEEAKAGGVNIPDLSSLGYHVQMIDAASNFKLTLQLDTNKANHMLQQLGTDVTFDSKLNGQKFSIAIPSVVQVQYGRADDGFFTYQQFSQPQLNAPQGVDLRQLRNTVIQLPFLPPNLAQQLSSMDNWEDTLPIPVIEGRQTSQKVTVNGVQGILVEDVKDQNVNLYWQKNGVVHSIAVPSVNGKEVMNADQVLQMAKQFQ